MRTALVAGAALVMVTVGAAGQMPVFDAASVKPHVGGPPVALMGTRGDQFTATNMPVRQLVAYAFALPASRVVGGPGWIDQDRFDITARPPEGAPPEQIRLMVRALFADRFKLATRRQMREATVYSLVRSRPDRLGDRIVPSTLDCAAVSAIPVTPPIPGQTIDQMAAAPRRCTVSTFSNGTTTIMRAGRITMEDLARTLTQRLDTPVTDRTGLAGAFDFDLRYAALLSQPAIPPPDADQAPPIFTALSEQLGLRLEPAKAPLEFIVIDRVERPEAN
jgi:uncharacterized protein (TIGR03435 family)